jgi:hypothetical protein
VSGDDREMEALRTQMDNLQWELQRLRVENRKLREQHPEASELVDREAELARARDGVAEMTERVKLLERQLADSVVAATEAERRATAAEGRVAELSDQVKELSAAGRGDEEDERNAGGGTPDATVVAQLEEALRDSTDRVRRLEAELVEAHAERETAVADGETERERAELERYRALEQERRRWEARESRVVSSLEAAEEELRATRATSATAVEVGENARLRDKVGVLTDEVDTARSIIDSLTMENSRLAQENESLSRENLSVQRRQTVPANPPTVHESREGDSVVEGGRGAFLHWTSVAGRLDRDGHLGQHPSTEQTRSRGRDPVAENAHPLAGVVVTRVQSPRDTGVVVGEGVGGETMGGYSGEMPHLRGNSGGALPVTTQTMARPAQVSHGCVTRTTFSSNCPRLVTHHPTCGQWPTHCQGPNQEPDCEWGVQFRDKQLWSGWTAINRQPTLSDPKG